MNKEFWLDGFNCFHHWDNTKGLFRSDSGFDIVRAMDRALRMLARQLGSRAKSTVVFMDGGLSRHETSRGAMRVRYCGPGKKADDRMAYDLEELGQDARLVTAVSNDRELKARMRMHGATCLGVGEFLAVIEGKKHPARPGGKQQPRSGGPKGVDADVMREKCRTLSSHEVSAWLELFGGEVEG